MAASYEIKEQRTKKMDYNASGEDKITATFVQTFDIEVTGLDAWRTNAVDVLNAPGLPKPNKTIYKTDDGTAMVPFLLCRSITTEQSPQRLSRWKVVATFKGQFEGGNPGFVGGTTAASDILPKVTTKIGEMEQVIYEDKTTAVRPGKRYISPSGSWYDEPLIEPLPTLEVTVQQYEQSILYSEMLERRFKCNISQYRDYPFYTWLIQDVQGTEVELPLSTGTVTVAQVTYTIHHNPRILLGTQIGWHETRAQIDTHYLETADDFTTRTEFKDSALGLLNMGQIFSNGTKRGDDKQDSPPLYQLFRPYSVIEFNSFLQA